MVSCLTDEVVTSPQLDRVLAEAEHHLKSHLGYLELQFDLSPQLLSIRPLHTANIAALRNLVEESLIGLVNKRQIVESAHSVDVLGELASKLRVVEAVTARTRSQDPGLVLRIGDQGAWGGNDYELLASGLSLSVDRVSGDLSTCWNISRPGRRSDLATADYLRALKVWGHGFRLKVALADFNQAIQRE